MFNFLATAILVPSLAVGAVGAPLAEMNMDYTGAVDINSGEPLESMDEDGFSSGGAVVSLPDGGIYNRNDHVFIYSAENSSLSVQASVANNMVTTEPVSVVADDGLDIDLCLNSKPVTDTDLTRITAPGSYTVVARGADNDYQVMTFTIVSKYTGALDRYVLPTGFTVSEVIFDSEEMSDFERKEVDFSSEGQYEVKYRCTATGVDYNLKVYVDHTPPDFTLTGLEEGVARGPVAIGGLAEDDTVTVTFGDKEVNVPYDGVFKNVGRYKVVVTDKAGNSKEESFTIRMYLNSQGIIFFLLAVAIIVATVAFLVLSRKNMRVR